MHRADVPRRHRVHHGLAVAEHAGQRVDDVGAVRLELRVRLLLVGLRALLRRLLALDHGLTGARGVALHDRRLLRAEPHRHGEACFLGLVLRGQTNEATEMFESGLKLRRQLAAAQPDLVEAKNRLAVLLIDYAAIPNFNNQAEKALALYNEAYTIISDLRSRDPENPDLKRA